MTIMRVGRFIVTAAGFPAEIERDMADALTTAELAYARAAYEAGNPEALPAALRLIRDRPRIGAPWPIDAAAIELAGPGQAPAARGRSANPRGRLRADVTDLERYVCVVRAMLIEAPTRPWAAALSELRTRGHSLASVRALKVSYRRCRDRLQREPARYYPFTDWALTEVFHCLKTLEPSEDALRRFDAQFSDAPDGREWLARVTYFARRIWTVPEIAWHAAVPPHSPEKNPRCL